MRKRVIALLFIMLICTQLCGFSLSNKKVIIDTEKKPVYEYITADTFLNSIDISEDTAKKKYDDHYLLISGMFESHNASKKSFTIMSRDFRSITCEYDKSFKETLNNYIYKDSIAVYGKCDVSFGKFKINEVKKVIAYQNAKSSEQYYTLDGTFLDKSTASERTLNNNRIKYYIPSSWKSVEKSIREEERGSIEGYQYVLNRLSDSNRSDAESLFVCYFDKKLLKVPDEIKKTEDIEKMIVNNIEGKVDGFPSKEADTYYGSEYQYYLGKYTDLMDVGKGYHTEYVFQKDGNNGIIMYLYLYREPTHISDIMLITRLLEINK